MTKKKTKRVRKSKKKVIVPNTLNNILKFIALCGYILFFPALIALWMYLTFDLVMP